MTEELKLQIDPILYDHVYEKTVETEALESTLVNITHLLFASNLALGGLRKVLEDAKAKYGNPLLMLITDTTSVNALDYYTALITVTATETAKLRINITIARNVTTRTLDTELNEWVTSHKSKLVSIIASDDGTGILHCVPKGESFGPMEFRSGLFTQFIETLSGEFNDLVKHLTDFDTTNLSTSDEWVNAFLSRMATNRISNPVAINYGQITPWHFLGWDMSDMDDYLIRRYLGQPLDKIEINLG